jgi:hypothetical protein
MPKLLQRAAATLYWHAEPSCDEIALDALDFIKAAVNGDEDMARVVITRLAEWNGRIPYATR